MKMIVLTQEEIETLLRLLDDKLSEDKDDVDNQILDDIRDKLGG